MDWRLSLLLATSAALAACSSDVDTKVSAAAREVGAVPMQAGRASNLYDLGTARRFASLPDRGSLVRYPESRIVRREGPYTWHRADLSESHARAAIGGVLELQSPSGERLRFSYERHEEQADGNWTWIGSVAGDAAREAVITFGEKAVFGSIAQGRQSSPLKLTVRDGVGWLVETDAAGLAGLPDTFDGPDHIVPPMAALQATHGAASSAVALPTPAGSHAASSVEVTLVLGYTNGFLRSMRGDSQARTRLQYLVALTNEALVNSNVPVHVVLQRMVRVDYPEATTNAKALADLTGRTASGEVITPAASLADLRRAREHHAADLVSLVRAYTDPVQDGCGTAWLIGAGRKGSITQADAEFGFSVVNDGRHVTVGGTGPFCREESLAHELGHNFGLQHDRVSAAGADGVLQESEYGVFEHSFGYRGPGFHTLMASVNTGSFAYRVFSNPRITSCSGAPCGVEGSADNARALTQTATAVSQFRVHNAWSQNLYAAPRDINGDGRSDIAWHNPDTGEAHYFALDGASYIDSLGAYTVPVGFRIVAIGHFDDGHETADVLWSDGTWLWLSRSRPAGGFAPVEMLISLQGYGVVGWQMRTGDISGDGVDDIVFLDRLTSAMRTWVSNAGISNPQEESAFSTLAGTGLSLTSVSDVDGDGSADVVAQDGAGNVYVSLREGPSRNHLQGKFGPPQRIFGGVEGWKLVAAADVSGDGASDLVWHHPGLGEVHVHCLRGTAITCNRGGYYLPRGHAIRQLGDYNADGRADLLASNGTRMAMSFANATGSFDPPVEFMAHVKGWLLGDDLAPVPLPPGDINRDGRTDLFWFSPALREIHYHLMNGRNIVGGRGGFHLAPGLEPKAVGDFDGDGRADAVLWEAGAGRIMLARPDGSWLVGNTFDSGTGVAGVGDFDGDGKSDLIARTTSDLSEYWVYYMDGAHQAVGSPASLGLGYRVQAVGDFDGDGRADVAASNASDVRLSLGTARRSSPFRTPVRVLPAFTGWALVGAADINGDQRADILWHNAGTGEVFAYFMDGTTVLGGRGWNVAVGYQLHVAGDFNADGYADLAWSNDQRVVITMNDGSGQLQAPTDLLSVVEGWGLVGIGVAAPH